MPRLVAKLTPLAVSKFVKPGYYGDGAGLWLQVSPSGSKSWIFRFTLAGRQREMGLGAVHTVSLPEARAKAKACRQSLLDGQDLLDKRVLLMQAWADYCGQPATAAKVTPIRGMGTRKAKTA